MEDEKMVELISIEHQIKSLKLELLAYEQREEELKNEIIEEMQNDKLEVIENDEIRIKYVAPIVRETIDASKLKKEYPDIAHMCLKQNEIKANLKITLKGE